MKDRMCQCGRAEKKPNQQRCKYCKAEIYAKRQARHIKYKENKPKSEFYNVVPDMEDLDIWE